MNLSVIILTYNEEANLANCLNSLQDLEAEVFIIDSGSNDRTLEIAQSYNCQVYTNPFQNQAQQLNWGLENIPITTPWIMRLDADERLTPELVKEIKETLPITPKEIGGYQMKRRVYFMGRWIRHGGYYPTWLLRIWRNGNGICEQRWMDEHIILSSGNIANLQHDIIDENQKGLGFWVNKHNSYADREVKDMLAMEEAEENEQNILEKNQISQASQRRWVKKNLYSKSPLFLRAFIYWLLRYTIGLGFLDGIEGMMFHFLQGFWYRFLVDAKIFEIKYKIKQNK
ncbi:glycosyltransferase family 2 protein [Cyanobacterium aponinum AL20118]|uniref:Glycosyltransferase family 2 protein n=1 Tax=Cyanobacterium aponinum AL20115 TaxID=3090662 RepID=A0AAF0ZA25_9CHRO|nr:glycosyltransferase family 2 protein [Cyanobacterium aponinum]WPF88356.1 glycosyltransferase family 2 protein [Cyanobacterium aponinum AL20115]